MALSNVFRNPFKLMSRDLILLSLSLLTWGIGEGMFFIFQPLYLQQLGADPIAIGIILSAAGIMMTVAHIPAGHLADRIGRKPLLMSAWILAIVATWIMALAPSLPMFIAGMLAYNLTTFVSSPLSSYITAARGQLSVTRALTMVSAYYSTGSLLGPALGGQVGNLLGIRSIFFIAGSIFIISFVLLFLIKSQPVETLDDKENGNLGFVNKRFVIYLAAIFFAGFSMYLAQPFSANYLQNQKNISLESIGVLGSFSSMGIVAFNLLVGNLNPYLGYLLGQAAVALFALILWRQTTFPWYCVGYFLLGGYRMTLSLATALTRNLVHQSRMGLAYGMTATVGASAVIPASALAGFLYQSNPSLMYIAGFCLILLSLVICAIFIPRPKAGI